jgi:hypothetical protein
MLYLVQPRRLPQRLAVYKYQICEIYLKYRCLQKPHTFDKIRDKTAHI